MPFIDEILQYSSLSIIGMEKNTGKTECLNYIINRINEKNMQNKGSNDHIKVAITSFGIDGESVDLVTKTHKPEIELQKGMLFVTSEKHFRMKRVTAEVVDVSSRKTSLGRLVTAQVILPGSVIISGPSTTKWLENVIQNLPDFGADLTIVDGALSRKSSGSPALTQSLILTTGAAVSPHIPELIKKTKFIYQLINLSKFQSCNEALIPQLIDIESGIFSIDHENKIHDLSIPSTLLLEKYKDKLFEFGYTFFVAGAVTDHMLNLLKVQKEVRQTLIIVKDFTRIFATPEIFYSYLKAGGQIQLLHKNKLIAICINPTSPSGYTIDSLLLRQQLQKELNISVYDIKQPL